MELSGPRVRKSGRPDLNRGPHRPERCALPGCATPRGVEVWTISVDRGDRGLDPAQARPVLQRAGPLRAADDRRRAGADAEIGADPRVGVEPLTHPAVGVQAGGEGVLPIVQLQLLDRARDRLQEVLVNAQAPCLVLVLEEQVGVLPAIALAGGGLGAEESQLLRAL